MNVKQLLRTVPATIMINVVILTVGASAAPANSDATISAPRLVTFETLLSEARKMNPEIAAAALDAEAAAARADAAGRLSDPNLTLLSDQNQRGWPTPGTRGNLTYTVQQSFPLWGKRGLKRDAAQAETRLANSDRKAVEREILSRVRSLYADYYRATRALLLVEEGHQVVHGLAATVVNRYAQGLADRQDLALTGIERSRFEADKLRLQADIRRSAIRLNTLLARPTNTPLNDPAPPRPVPPVDHLNPEMLAEQALQENPAILAQNARIEAATANRKLSDKAWYPDITTGIGLVDNAGMNGNGRRWSYEAMLSVNLPLSWGLKQAGQHEASAMLSSAQAKRQAALINAEADIDTALTDLQAAEEIIATIRDDRLLQANLAWQAALDAYQNGRTPLRPVIESYHQWLEAKLDLLTAEAEQQSRFADLERAVGADL